MLRLLTAEWMRHQGNWQRWHAQARGFVAAELTEFIGAEHHRRHATRFYLDSVVDTPRRTGASISGANKDRVTPQDDVCEQFVRRAYGRVRLAAMHNLHRAMLLTKQCRHTQHEHVSV